MKNVTEDHLENGPSQEGFEANAHQQDLPDAQAESIDPVAKLEAELSGMQDKYLRLVAEFENFKKRASRERTDLLKTAGSDVVLSVLPVLDDFERAIKAANDSAQPLAEGILLIYNKLRSNLESRGLKPMDAAGKPFDSDFHDAIVQVPATDESSKGKVLEEVTKGYFLNDKVIRHAKVVVSV